MAKLKQRPGRTIDMTVPVQGPFFVDLAGGYTRKSTRVAASRARPAKRAGARRPSKRPAARPLTAAQTATVNRVLRDLSVQLATIGTGLDALRVAGGVAWLKNGGRLARGRGVIDLAIGVNAAGATATATTAGNTADNGKASGTPSDGLTAEQRKAIAWMKTGKKPADDGGTPNDPTDDNLGPRNGGPRLILMYYAGKPTGFKNGFPTGHMPSPIRSDNVLILDKLNNVYWQCPRSPNGWTRREPVPALRDPSYSGAVIRDKDESGKVLKFIGVPESVLNETLPVDASKNASRSSKAG